MLPGMELPSCPEMAVSHEVMQHIVRVESSHNPYAIGVVGGRLVRQPRNLSEALSTVRMLESRGYNFSIGIAQVNRYNLGKYGLTSYAHAFEVCPNLQAGARILAECHRRHQDWGKSFSCYYSGNPVTGFRHGYVQKVFASMARAAGAQDAGSIAVKDTRPSRRVVPIEHFPLQGNQRIDVTTSRTSPLDPTVRPVATSDPALVGGGSMREAGTSPAPTRRPSDAPSHQPAVPGPAGPVLLGSGLPAASPPQPVPPFREGDGAFVF